MKIDEEQKEIFDEFILEARDMLDETEPMFMELESVTDAGEIELILNNIFRLFHSFKGGAGFLNLKSIERVTHAAESVLQGVRVTPDSLEKKHVEALIASCDLLRQILAQVEQEYHDEGFEQQVEEITAYLGSGLENDSKPLKASVAPQASSSIDQSTQADAVQNLELPSMNNADTGADYSVQLTAKLKKNFIISTEEELDQMEGALLVLEKLSDEVDTAEYIDTIFRNIHSIKGNAGFIGLDPIERLSHKAENVLSKMKEHSLPVSLIIDIFLAIVDSLRQATANLANDAPLVNATLTDLMQRLDRLIQGDTTVLPPSGSESAVGEILINMGAVNPGDVDEALQKQKEPIGEILIEMGKTNRGAVGHALTQQTHLKSKNPGAVSTSSLSTQRQDIRVGLNKVDELISLVGELVISEAMVANNPDLQDLVSASFVKAVRQHNKNIRELQEVAMSMRMVPVSTTFRKMIRLVHDVSKKTEKLVKLELIGEETEVDKTLIEQINDPLVHILRNAVDHGLETPEVRKAFNKPETGTIRLEAKHSGNEVWILIEEDGQGLNRQKILNKAIERNLADANEILTDEEVWQLIFAPGFSTSNSVTDLSGRGIGMDVVKSNIEKLGGRVDIISKESKGTTFILRIPLTLAIIEGMLVRVGQASCTIPIISIRESFIPKAEQITQTMDGTEMVRIRDELLQIVRLYELHSLTSDITDLTQGTLLILENDKKRLCLFVDDVVGRQQIVVKSLPEYLNEIALSELNHISGCTILGNGGISLILDVGSLIDSTEME